MEAEKIYRLPHPASPCLQFNGGIRLESINLATTIMVVVYTRANSVWFDRKLCGLIGRCKMSTCLGHGHAYSAHGPKKKMEAR